ncbi:hypothetical protein RB653_010525 [Dictyostelium firmibasis]|uniref:Uncharacterized protein n=1 Tax=Dictyostelium firmibasis TaxID=79012 RepID=A0AAN7U1S3_9MYCE
MKYITFIILFIYLFLNCQNVHAAPKKPLSSTETNVALDILLSLYNVDSNSVNEICDFNGCFECQQIQNTNNYTVTSIKMINSSNTYTVTQNLTVFTNLLKLDILDEKVQLPTLFYNQTLSKLSKLEQLTISNQEQVFPEKFLVPISLYNVFFLKISVPISSIWFESTVNSLFIENTLPGFKYPNLTKENPNLRGLKLTINQVESTIPSTMKLYPNLIVLLFNIYNEMSVVGYKNFSIDSIKQEYVRVTSLEFNFINSGNDSSIQKFPLQQSLISKFQLENLDFIGIGLTLDPSVGYLNFSMMSEYGLILTINGTCDLVNECKVSNCIVMPNVVPPKISRNKINIGGCVKPSLTPSLQTTTSSSTGTSLPTTTTTTTSTTSSTTSSNKLPIEEKTTSPASSLSFSLYIYIYSLAIFLFVKL